MTEKQLINTDVCKVKDLKKGMFFTKKPLEFPTDRQVWIRGNYCRDIKKYECICFDDINYITHISGDKPAYLNFTF